MKRKIPKPTTKELAACPRARAYTPHHKVMIQDGDDTVLKSATKEERDWLKAFDAAWLGSKRSPFFTIISELEGRTGRGSTLEQTLKKDAMNHVNCEVDWVEELDVGNEEDEFDKAYCLELGEGV